MFTEPTNTNVASDAITIARACERFVALREHLPQVAVAETDEVLARLPIDPRNATAGEAWRAMWDKSLYSGVWVATGRRWVQELVPFMENAWMVWGAEPERFLITRTGHGRDAGSFDIAGSQAQQLRAASGTPVHRLFALQNAATLLHGLAAQSDTPVLRFWTEPLDTLSPLSGAQLRLGVGRHYGAAHADRLRGGGKTRPPRHAQPAAPRDLVIRS